MKKFLFLCTALALVSPSAYAQFELNDEEIKVAKKKEEKIPDEIIA